MNNNLRISFAPMKVRRNITMKNKKVPVATPLAPSTRRASIQKVNKQKWDPTAIVYGTRVNEALPNNYYKNLNVSATTQSQNTAILSRTNKMKQKNNSSLYIGVVNLPEAPVRNPYKHIFQKNKGSRSLKTNYVNPISGGVSRKVKVRSLPKYRKTYKRITY